MIFEEQYLTDRTECLSGTDEKEESQIIKILNMIFISKFNFSGKKYGKM
jgi:hypothetical protein